MKHDVRVPADLPPVERPLFSVVMPSYEHGAFIGDAVESVLGQTQGDLELIVIDDCSQDDSVERVSELAERDDRLRLIVHPERRGIPRTLNDGLERARGRWVTFLASDDLWLPGMLEQQEGVLARDPDAVAWTDARVTGPDGTDLGGLAGNFAGDDAGRDVLAALAKGNFLCLSALAVETEVAQGIRFDESLAYLNDYLFLLELAARRRFVQSGPARLIYRRHDSNCTNLSDRGGWVSDALRMLSIVSDRLSHHVPADILGELGRHLEGLVRGLSGNPGFRPTESTYPRG